MPRAKTDKSPDPESTEDSLDNEGGPHASEESDSAPEETKTPKCDNHPHRNATNFTEGGAVDINLCPECTPEWFKDPE